MARIFLIEGPVGAGKSTFALQLSNRHAGPCLILDDWMATLFRPDRPSTGVMEWYIERKDRCIEQIWKLTRDLIEAGTDVILELGLIRERDRQRLYGLVDAAAYDLTIYVLDASREIRRERVQNRNRTKGDTFSMDVPDDFFEFASDMWEPLEDFECRNRDVRFLSTDC
jgi:predicted kinase